MTPRQKATLRAEEIQKTLDQDSLPADEHEALENELDAIVDNLAEGCYSNDPDDGIDWPDCPGIYHSPEMNM